MRKNDRKIDDVAGIWAACDGMSAGDGVGDDVLAALCRTGAAHDDAGKARLDLIPAMVLVEVGAVMGFGAEKYGPHNWRAGMRWGRLYASLLRHLLAWWNGETVDSESGLPHLAHVMACAMMLRDYERGGAGEDDRQ